MKKKKEYLGAERDWALFVGAAHVGPAPRKPLSPKKFVLPVEDQIFLEMDQTCLNGIRFSNKRRTCPEETFEPFVSNSVPVEAHV